MSFKRIFIFVGTTAELIKLAPVIHEFNKRKVEFTIVTSGQNDIHFEDFRTMIGKVRIVRAITPKGGGSSIIKFILWALRSFFSLLVGMRSNFGGLNKSNSLFIVHGDTVSSLMGSLVASLYGLRLVHIESGLRSFNFYEPFPEEFCRYVISHLADVHFCPNLWSLRNLSGVKGEKVNTYENTLIETYYSTLRSKSRISLVKQVLKKGNHYFIMVAHRQEHVLFHRNETKDLLRFVLNETPNQIQCLFLVHDISAGFVDSLDLLIPESSADRITRVGRLPYNEFMQLVRGAEFIVTDGGSNQEEAYYMGKPCLLLRTTTERKEGLHENVVLSKNNPAVVRNFLKSYRRFQRKPIHMSVRPSKIIVNYLLKK